MAWSERRIDLYFVFALRELQQVPMGQTKAPVLFVVGGAVGDIVRTVRKCVQMLSQLDEGHLLVNWNTVIHDMKIASMEIDNPTTSSILDECVVDDMEQNPFIHQKAYNFYLWQR